MRQKSTTKEQQLQTLLDDMDAAMKRTLARRDELLNEVESLHESISQKDLEIKDLREVIDTWQERFRIMESRVADLREEAAHDRGRLKGYQERVKEIDIQLIRDHVVSVRNAAIKGGVTGGDLAQMSEQEFTAWINGASPDQLAAALGE